MDGSLAAALIEAQFPALAPARVSTLGEGCDSIAFDVNGEWVFRFPKRDDVARQCEMEARILPALAEQLPVAVPRFRFHGQPSSKFARSFVGYGKLPGEPAICMNPGAVPMDRLVQPLAAFLAALHAFPIATAAAAGAPAQRVDEVIAGIQAEALGELERVRAVDPSAPVAAWRQFIEAGINASLPSGRAALVHNDLAAEHVLFDPTAQAITGVIDWSDAVISDPVVDVAGLLHWGGEPFARAVLDACDGEFTDSDFRVARYIAACRGAMDVAFGLDHGRREYVIAGLNALHLCAA